MSVSKELLEPKKVDEEEAQLDEEEAREESPKLLPMGSVYKLGEEPEEEVQEEEEEEEEKKVATLPSVNVTAGKNFRSHFVSHKALLEGVTGAQYARLKDDGPRFLADIGRLISTLEVSFVGQGTLKKGQDPMKIYRGKGITIVLTLNDEFVTLLETGKGLDLAILLI